MVKIKRERFKEMFKLRGISEKKFGLKLEEDQIITYRSLQRNLSSESMKESVLNECAKRLNCHPAYLDGKSNIIHEKSPLFNRYHLEMDSKGIVVNTYESYLADLQWDNKLDYFKDWIKSMQIYSVCDGVVYTLNDLVQSRLKSNDIYDEVNVYDDLMEACCETIREFITSEFSEEKEG